MGDILLVFIQDNLLSIFVFVVTVVLLIYLAKDNSTSKKISKRYRESIYEAQTRIYLNATKNLISGDREQAIKDFLAAVEVSKETLDAYFALGELLRTNGEIDKAVSIHQSIVARENINEQARIKALKELAIDYDRGGFIEEAIKSYKDLLVINKEDEDVVTSLCLIYEGIEEWDEAIKYRTLLSKITNRPEDMTISHIIVQKGFVFLEKNEKNKAIECLDQAIHYAPSLSVKLFEISISVVDGNIDLAKSLLHDFVHEHPNKARMVMDVFYKLSKFDYCKDKIQNSLDEIRDYFLSSFKDQSIKSSDYKIFKLSMLDDGLDSIPKKLSLLRGIIENEPEQRIKNKAKVEICRLLLSEGKQSEALDILNELRDSGNRDLVVNQCYNCGYESNHFFWRCPQCHKWESINFKEVI